MEWHQAWLLSLGLGEVEKLIDDAREREKASRRRGEFGLARAWAGLAHEAFERAMEIEGEIRDDEFELHPFQEHLPF